MAELSKSQDNQQELFQEFLSDSKKVERFTSLPKSQKPILISTHSEQLLLLGILFILWCCLVFFLGVLRGRSMTQVRPFQPAAQVAVIPKKVFPLNPEVAVKELPKAAVVNTPVLAQSSRKPYTIQLVTYKKKELAEEEAVALRRSGLITWIIPSGDYYQVCVGQYQNKEEAKKDLKFFAVKHKDCFLRRR